MNDFEINPITWFAERELSYPPAHFVTATTHVTIESKQWVQDYLIGRYSIIPGVSDWVSVNDDTIGVISFEDPKEATIFELKWS